MTIYKNIFIDVTGNLSVSNESIFPVEKSIMYIFITFYKNIKLIFYKNI